MSNRKVFALCLLSNVLLLAVAAGVFVLAQPALAQSPSGGNWPNGAKMPAGTIGPYFDSYSPSDFHQWSDDFPTTRESGGYAVLKVGGFGAATTGVHLPPGAIIIGVANDSEAINGGHTTLYLKRCKVGVATCTTEYTATQGVNGRNAAVDFHDLSIDASQYTYFLEIDLPDDSKFWNAFVEYTLPSSFLYMPSIVR